MRLLLVLICPLAFGTEQELGERLFFDKQLSIDGTLSCATCHIPEQAFTDTRQPTPTGIDGTPLPRNAPTLLNVADRAVLFHDGRESNLDTQAITPLLNKKEMANPNPAVLITRISDDYQSAFAAINLELSIENIALTLAAYERTLTAKDTAYDRWRNKQQPLSRSAIIGFGLFNRHGCAACHLTSNAQFTDDLFHNTGVPDSNDLGLFAITKDPTDRYRFRTPTLRNIQLTEPYMHNGSIPTLRGVIEFYMKGRSNNPSIDNRILPFTLTEEEIESLISFLNTLTSPTRFEAQAPH